MVPHVGAVGIAGEKHVAWERGRAGNSAAESSQPWSSTAGRSPSAAAHARSTTNASCSCPLPASRAKLGSRRVSQLVKISWIQFFSPSNGQQRRQLKLLALLRPPPPRQCPSLIASFLRLAHTAAAALTCSANPDSSLSAFSSSSMFCFNNSSAFE